jgi:hypothetical protein
MSESFWHLDYAPQHALASCPSGKISAKNISNCEGSPILKVGVSVTHGLQAPS